LLGGQLHSDVIHSIYRAVEDFDHWPAALQAVADEMRAVGGLLVMLLPNSERVVISSPALEAAAKDYTLNWTTRDVRSNRLVERRLDLRLDTVIDEDVITPEEALADPFYVDFLRRHGLRHFCASLVSPKIGTTVALSLQRSNGQGAFNAAERARVFGYSRHIERALHLYGRLEEQAVARATLEAVIARHQQMVLLVTVEGRVILDNAAAPDLLRRFVLHGAHTRRLNRAVLPQGFGKIMEETARGGGLGPVTAFSPATEDGSAVAITILPGPFGSGSAWSSERNTADGRVILVFTATGSARSYDPALARDFLKVTLGEARVAALIAAGDSPKTVAGKLRLTEQTVRFVLGQIYQKTGLKRQNELAAAMAQLTLTPG
jgi:DNA-binding CsgD family transcriptional regulator